MIGFNYIIDVWIVMGKNFIIIIFSNLNLKKKCNN